MHLAGGTLVRRLTQDASLAPAPETNPAALTTKTQNPVRTNQRQNILHNFPDSNEKRAHIRRHRVHGHDSNVKIIHRRDGVIPTPNIRPSFCVAYICLS